MCDKMCPDKHYSHCIIRIKSAAILKVNNVRLQPVGKNEIRVLLSWKTTIIWPLDLPCDMNGFKLKVGNKNNRFVGFDLIFFQVLFNIVFYAMPRLTDCGTEYVSNNFSTAKKREINWECKGGPTVLVSRLGCMSHFNEPF